jgi:hypothetical protein
MRRLVGDVVFLAERATKIYKAYHLFEFFQARKRDLEFKMQAPFVGVSDSADGRWGHGNWKGTRDLRFANAAMPKQPFDQITTGRGQFVRFAEEDVLEAPG